MKKPFNRKKFDPILKKAVSILLLITFFVYQQGNYLLFNLVKYFEKEKLEASILRSVPENECEIIDVASNAGNIQWEKQDEIFYLNGIMYDVSKKKVVDGNVYLYCIKESREMEIMDDLTLKISADTQGNSSFELCDSDEYVISKIDKPQLPYSWKKAAYFYYTIPTSTGSKKILIPPPRSVLS